MDEIDRLQLKASIVNEECGLNHGGWDCPNPQAVDCLIVPFGYKTGEIEYLQTNEFTIPLCECCSETLFTQDKEWILYYCINCNNSQWFIRKLKGIPEDKDMIQWLDTCPYCK